MFSVLVIYLCKNCFVLIFMYLIYRPLGNLFKKIFLTNMHLLETAWSRSFFTGSGSDSGSSKKDRLRPAPAPAPQHC